MSHMADKAVGSNRRYNSTGNEIRQFNTEQGSLINGGLPAPGIHLNFYIIWLSFIKNLLYTIISSNQLSHLDIQLVSCLNMGSNQQVGVPQMMV